MIACFTSPTTIYKEFTRPSNFKACCVRRGEEGFTSEQIAAMHPDGSGWAGLFEYYYNTAVVGMENARTDTMIIGKDERENVQRLIDEADPVMEDDQAVKWVTDAIERNYKAQGGSGQSSSVQDSVKSVIKEIRPQDKELRFADSLEGMGLTMRPNYASMDLQYRIQLARRFCMRDEQFLKLMDPSEDLLQLGGGPSVEDLRDLPVWANYSKRGVQLMTDPQQTLQLENMDKTPTDLPKGMREGWLKDPLFCQRMQLDNPNFESTGMDAALKEGQGVRAPLSKEQVGFTCLNGVDQEEDGEHPIRSDGLISQFFGMLRDPFSRLNGALVPVVMYNHAPVQRRTAIADHLMRFMIAGALVPGLREPGTGRNKRSVYKRFEPRGYSWKHLPEELKAFRGKQFKGGGTNELGRSCKDLSGKDFQGQNKSDQLYISDATHPEQAFTDKPIINNEQGGFNRYRQEWAKEGTARDQIANRGLDEFSSNYVTPFRIFATCPAGYVRWRPPEDPDNLHLAIELNLNCQEENFGGLSRPSF